MARPQNRHILLASCRKSSQPIEEFQLRCTERSAALRASRGNFFERSRGLDQFGDPLELIGQASVLRHKHNAGCGDKQGARVWIDQVRSKDEYPAWPMIVSRSGPRLTGAHQRLDRRLKVLNIRRFALVQNDKVNGELLHPPIFVSLQDLAGDIETLDLGDSQQHDRKIAGYALRPQTGLRTGALPNYVRGRAQIGSGEDDVACETLKKSGLAGVDPKMMELHLRLGPGQRRCTRIRGSVPMFVDAIQQRCARLCRHRPEGDANRRPRRHANTPAQCEDWIEHGSDRIGQRPIVHDRDCRANTLSAAQKARPVGFELRPADRFSIGDAQMRRPKCGFRRRPLSPRREYRAAVLEVFGLDEHLCKGRMSDICSLRPQSEFVVGCDLDVARPPSCIGYGYAAHLGVVLSRDKHLERCRQSAVSSRDLDAVLVEIDGILIGLSPRRLKTGRPDGAAPYVPKKDIGAAIVSRSILSPSRDGDVAPPAVSGAGRRQHHGIAPV